MSTLPSKKRKRPTVKDTRLQNIRDQVNRYGLHSAIGLVSERNSNLIDIIYRMQENVQYAVVKGKYISNNEIKEWALELTKLAGMKHKKTCPCMMCWYKMEGAPELPDDHDPDL